MWSRTRLARRRGFSTGAGNRFHGTAEHLAQSPFQPHQADEVDPGRRIELRRQVHVAIGRIVAARHRAEQRQPPDAGGAQRRLMRAQRGEHLVGEGSAGRRRDGAHGGMIAGWRRMPEKGFAPLRASPHQRPKGLWKPGLLRRSGASLSRCSRQKAVSIG